MLNILIFCFLSRIDFFSFFLSQTLFSNIIKRSSKNEHFKTSNSPSFFYNNSVQIFTVSSDIIYQLSMKKKYCFHIMFSLGVFFVSLRKENRKFRLKKSPKKVYRKKLRHVKSTIQPW